MKHFDACIPCCVNAIILGGAQQRIYNMCVLSPYYCISRCIVGGIYIKSFLPFDRKLILVSAQIFLQISRQQFQVQKSYFLEYTNLSQLPFSQRVYSSLRSSRVKCTKQTRAPCSPRVALRTYRGVCFLVFFVVFALVWVRTFVASPVHSSSIAL